MFIIYFYVLCIDVDRIAIYQYKNIFSYILQANSEIVYLLASCFSNFYCIVTDKKFQSLITICYYLLFLMSGLDFFSLYAKANIKVF